MKPTGSGWQPRGAHAGRGSVVALLALAALMGGCGAHNAEVAFAWIAVWLPASV